MHLRYYKAIIFSWVFCTSLIPTETRILRMSCNSSGLTAINLICKFKSISRTNQLLSVGYEVIKQLNEVKLSFTMLLKTVTNWRQLMNSPVFEFCSLIKSSKKIPFFSDMLSDIGEQFVGVQTSCPIKLGRYYNYNVSYLSIKNTLPSPIGLPNGRYKYILKFSNEIDPMIVKLEYENEVYNRLNTTDF